MKKQGCLHSWPACNLLCSPTENLTSQEAALALHLRGSIPHCSFKAWAAQHLLSTVKSWGKPLVYRQCRNLYYALFSLPLEFSVEHCLDVKELRKKVKGRFLYLLKKHSGPIMFQGRALTEKREIRTVPSGQFLCSQAGQERLQGKANIAKNFCNAQLNKQLQIVWIKAEKLPEWVLNLFSAS